MLCIEASEGKLKSSNRSHQRFTSKLLCMITTVTLKRLRRNDAQTFCRKATTKGLASQREDKHSFVRAVSRFMNQMPRTLMI